MRDSNRELFSLAYALRYNADRILYEIKDEPNWIAAESYMRKFFFLIVLAKDASKSIDDYGSDNAVIDTVHGLMQRYQHKAGSIRMKKDEDVTDDEKNEVSDLLTAIVGLCEVLVNRKRS